MAEPVKCDNGSRDTTWLPGAPYLVQIQRVELWLLQQRRSSNGVADTLGNRTACLIWISLIRDSSPFLTDGKGQDTSRWMLRPEPEKSREAAEPHSTGDDWRWRDHHLCRIWSPQLGPALYRKGPTQRVWCLERTVLITSQFLHFLRQSAAKHNASYRSDVESQHHWCPGWGQWVPSVSGSKDNTIPGFAVCTQSGGRTGGRKGEFPGEQQEPAQTNLQDHHPSLRVGLLVTTAAGTSPRPKDKGNP